MQIRKTNGETQKREVPLRKRGRVHPFARTREMQLRMEFVRTAVAACTCLRRRARAIGERGYVCVCACARVRDFETRLRSVKDFSKARS